MKYLKPLLLILTFVLSSCYIYRPYTGEEEIVENTNSRRGGLATPSSFRSAQNTPSGLSPSATLSRDGGDPDKEKNSEEIKRKEEESKKINEELQRTGQLGTANKSQSSSNELTKENEAAKQKELEASKQKELEAELTLKEMLKPNRNYKITVEEKKYKVQVDKWEGDTLISHIIRKPDKVLKFHENQIDNEEVLERRFSKPISDMITVGSYIAVGATALLLLL